MPTSDSAPFLQALVRPARRLTAASLALLGIMAAACTESVPPPTIATLRIQPQIDSFFVGKASSANPFAVTLFDANTTDITAGRTITYSSTATDVFTVDSKTGVVTGKTLGSGFFRATADGRFIEAGVKIIFPVDRVQLNFNDFSMSVGSTRQLIPNLIAPDGSTISNRVVSYSSSNPNIVSVSTGGVVTSVAEGTATITASVEGKTANVIVTVTRDPVASIRMTPQVNQLMRVGGQLQVTALPLNNLGQALTGRTITWTTNNPAIATVNSQGVVTAIGVGNATVSAESETRIGTLGITVTEVPAKTVTIEPDTFQLGTNLSRQLAPTVIDSAGRVVSSFTNRQVVWQSSSSIVASVSTTGVVTGQGAGTARVWVTVDGVRSNDVVVQVAPLVATVRITPFNPQILRIGTTVQLSAQGLDQSNQVIPGKVANWVTNNPSVVSVSTNGLVTGIATGTTTVTAEIDNRTANLQITVTLVPVGSVTFTPASDTLVENDQVQFNPVVRDTSGKVITSLIGRNAIFTSNNLPIATVSNQGVVTAQAEGVATIVATIDGVVSNDLTIRVARVTSVTLSPNTASVAVGTTRQLTVTIRDAAGNTLTSSRPITWNTSNGGIASVTQAGVVTGVAAGTVTISANLNGVIGTATITVP